MELHELRYFVALSKILNFTKAADHCNVTQPALTRAIQKMEGELGGLLFSRERGNTHLTALGRTLAPCFNEIVARTADARQMAARFCRLEEARLTLGVQDSIGAAHFAPFLAGFRRDHPGVTLTVIDTAPDIIAGLLVKGEVDAAVMTLGCDWETRLHARLLYRERLVIACPADHRFAAMAELRGTDLGGQIYFQRSGCEYFDQLAAELAARGIAMAPPLRAERADWAQTMVAAGLGVQFLPEFSAVVPGLALRAVMDPEIARDVCLATVAGRRWSSPVTALVKAIGAFDWPGAPSRVPPADHAVCLSDPL